MNGNSIIRIFQYDQYSTTALACSVQGYLRQEEMKASKRSISP